MLLSCALLTALMLLLVVGFMTLLERKVLGYGVSRKGPNKALTMGLFQPLLDGVKLILKVSAGIKGSTLILAGVTLILSLVMGLWVWASALNMESCNLLGCSWAYYVVLVMGVFIGVMYFVMGVVAGGVYGVLGAVRGLSMVVAYEVAMSFVILGWSYYGGSCGVRLMGSGVAGFCVLTLWVLGLVTVVMEGGRSPVDFVEGESELVSGLTTEYGGLGFSLLFMVEYCFMGCFSWVFLAFVVNGGSAVLCWLCLAWVLNWLRVSLPRSRCDLVVVWGWLWLVAVSFSVVFVTWSALCSSDFSVVDVY